MITLKVQQIPETSKINSTAESNLIYKVTVIYEGVPFIYLIFDDLSIFCIDPNSSDASNKNKKLTMAMVKRDERNLITNVYSLLTKTKQIKKDKEYTFKEILYSTKSIVSVGYRSKVLEFTFAQKVNNIDCVSDYILELNTQGYL